MLIKGAQTLALCLSCGKVQMFKTTELRCSCRQFHRTRQKYFHEWIIKLRGFALCVNTKRIFFHHQLKCIIDKEISIRVFCEEGDVFNQWLPAKLTRLAA